MAREQLQNLSEPMYYLLLALQEPRHGYSIMQTVYQISGGRITVGAGTLYALLSRFESEGIVAIVSIDGRRKVYRITQKGKTLLDEEYTRLNIMVNDANRLTGRKEV